MKSISAVALAAAISPNQAPATGEDILKELRSPVGVTRIEEQAALTPSPATSLIQDPKPSSPPAEAAPGTAQDPKPAPAPTPEELKTISQQLRTLRLIEAEVYSKIAAGTPLNEVLREAESALQAISQGNKTAIGSIEKVLDTPAKREKFRDAQNEAKNALDDEMKVRLEERIRKFGTHQDARGRGGSGFLRDLEAESGAQVDKNPALRGRVDQAAKRLLEALQIAKSGDTYIDKSPKPYESDPKLKSALTVSPWMDKPSEGLKPEEIKALYERDRPKTDAEIAKINEVKGRQDALYAKVMAEQPEPVKEQLKALEKLAEEIAGESLVMESRGIVPGVDYDPQIVARLGYEAIPAIRDADYALIKSATKLKDEERATLKELRTPERRRR